ncbi:sulfhydrogenase subunit delta [Thiohalobacter sp.]|uniref:NADH-quinone oxidoreductase subunit B family protein n=1 Tax=Thiohalobacter sp. TaxID=2025948 RepID=UPI002621F9F4|nr:sulfhydrogenase subunit delta [Thiohalobacter sp.]
MKLRLAVHKFSSCDGCQLALLNLGELLLELAAQLEIVHFAEAGIADETAPADLALVEGSLSTPEDIARIRAIRDCSGWLVSIGACATAGGLQALRNDAGDGMEWPGMVYAHPEWLSDLGGARPIADEVRVDWSLWGCPVDRLQVLALIRARLAGTRPVVNDEKVCASCKRRGLACVMVANGTPCLGPVTRDGCGALCPGTARGCYGCYGPAEDINRPALDARLQTLGDSGERVLRRYRLMNAAAPGFRSDEGEGGS